MLLVHNTNGQVGTPEDLSCFTPSSVASISNAPSPVLAHFQPPDLLPNVDYIASQNTESVTLDFCSKDSEAVYDIMNALKGPIERLYESVLSLCRIVVKQLTGSRFRRSALVFLVSFSALSGSEREKFLISLRMSDITTRSDVRGVASAFEVSITEIAIALAGILPDLITNLLVCSNELCESIRSVDCFVSGSVVDWVELLYKCLEQKHNPPVRRSVSCESIRSLESFLSDPVVNWKDLLHGHNQ